jgi:hypothetical protein
MALVGTFAPTFVVQSSFVVTARPSRVSSADTEIFVEHDID